MFNALQDPFRGLKSDHLRRTYLESSNCYVPPKSYTISDGQLKVFNTKCGPVTKTVKTMGQFVPLRSVLKLFFELPGALSDTLNNMSLINEKQNVCNIIQCDSWRAKVSHFNASDIVMPLVFHCDEFEPNADLGPHSEKLAAGYVKVPVLPPECQSKLENIFLALLFRADDRKSIEVGKCSYNKEVFAPLVKEFTYLETRGIFCSTDMGGKHIYFVLAQILGDNLGMHSINGFAESFTCNFPCRMCKAFKGTIHSMTKADNTLLRDRINHAADVSTANVTETGIKEECVFNQVPSFHITENYAVDVMHDLSEGVSHYVIIPILQHCIDAGYFCLDVLNYRLAMFDYGPSDSRNKPPCISENFHTKDKLKCTAAQMTSLIRLLGIIIGDLVPEADQFWNLYKLHKQLQDIVLARDLPRDISDKLEILVHEHHSLFMKLTKRKLPPKFHFLLHYVRVFRKSGAPVHYSSMRYEAKHRDLIGYTNVITSRKNVVMSAAIKHQLGQCLRFVSRSPLSPPMVCGPGEVVDIRDHPKFLSFKQSLPNANVNDPDCERVNWIDYKGTRYEPRMVLILDTEDDGYLFGKVTDIYICNDQPLFLCNLFNCLGPSEHVGGYEVLKSQKYVSVLHQDLYDPFPVYDWLMCNGESYIVLKYYM